MSDRIRPPKVVQPHRVRLAPFFFAVVAFSGVFPAEPVISIQVVRSVERPAAVASPKFFPLVPFSGTFPAEPVIGFRQASISQARPQAFAQSEFFPVVPPPVAVATANPVILVSKPSLIIPVPPAISVSKFFPTVVFSGTFPAENNMLIEAFTMDGSSHDSDAGNHQIDATLEEDVIFGRRGALSSGSFDGDMAYAAYFSSVLTNSEILGYLRNPYQVVFSKGSAGCVFFVPMDGNLDPEIDLVNGNNFSITGSLSNGTNPPIGPFAASPVSFAAAAAAAAANPVIHFRVVE